MLGGDFIINKKLFLKLILAFILSINLSIYIFSISASASEINYVDYKVKITKKHTMLKVGLMEEIIVKINPNLSKQINKGNLIWKSSNEDIVEVNMEGKIFGKNIGKSRVTVQTKDGKYSDFVDVKVVNDIDYKIYNPYKNINWSKVKTLKSNLHCHTNKSDGKNTIQEVVDAHEKFGYDVLSITDHNKVTYPWNDSSKGDSSLKMTENLAGNNTPVFFFRDPMKFIDLNHAIKRDPRTNMRSPNTNWDFWSSLPESLHQTTIIMSDRGIPSSYRYMHGFSSHAYSMINEENERVWVKLHFRSQQGIQNFTDQEAEEIIADDRESHQRDLYEAIEKGQFPKWKMYIQVMTEEEAENMPYNPFDLTKIWYKGDYPLIPVGEFELNRNPDNYFAQVEQAAFTPANVVPGINFSPDRMLQARLFSYGDAHRYRLGVNHHQIPVNSPKGVEKPHSFHRDGQMRTDGNLGSELHYEPNSYGNWKEDMSEMQPMQDASDAYRYDFREDDHDYFTQPGELYRAMTSDQKRVLYHNTARNMGDATLQIKHRYINHCYQADPKYGEGVAKALKIDINDVDLNLPKSDSNEGNYEANNKHPELDVPSEDISKIPNQEEISTHYDPKKFVEPMDDPFLL